MIISNLTNLFHLEKATKKTNKLYLSSIKCFFYFCGLTFEITNEIDSKDHYFKQTNKQQEEIK